LCKFNGQHCDFFTNSISILRVFIPYFVLACLLLVITFGLTVFAGLWYTNKYSQILSSLYIISIIAWLSAQKL